MEQRRSHGRYQIWFPVRVTGSDVDGIAVNRNISATGMLVGLSTRLEVGAAVELRFSVPAATEPERILRGKVVRIEPNTEDPDGMFPYRMAVAFDDPDPALIPSLEHAVRALAQQ
ncbi:MAG: PilZ domain-containing protein [Polyangiales bacterium]